eukprot:TRINITY_DN74828_c0_g1_i1.p1 TRINITY_DN74828_c0_g1~~TRINITY_DN74828_c0_g1_i1.p1  ORF type:complete len:455 (+),score=74.40 TRINITY_DN74828_c0_g1_i1:79-1365(+)
MPGCFVNSVGEVFSDPQRCAKHRRIEGNMDRWMLHSRLSRRSEEEAYGRETWLSMFDNIMTALIGTWYCQSGSVHQVFLDGNSTSSFAIKTIREDGKERITRALLKRDHHDHKTIGCIQWGQGFVLEPFQGCTQTVTWRPRCINSVSRPLLWTRVQQTQDNASTFARRASVSSQGDTVFSGRASMSKSRECSDITVTPNNVCAWSDESFDTREDASHRQRRQTRRSTHVSTDGIAPESDGSCVRQFSIIQGPKRKALSARLPRSGFSPEDIATFSMRQEKLEVEEATLRVREATLTIQEANAAQISLDAARKERAALAAEVEALTRKRIAEQRVVQGYKHEEEKMRAKLVRCREVVAVTVNSIDVMMRKGGNNDEILHAVGIAQAAAAEADEMIAFLDSETTDADSRGLGQVSDTKDETSESPARSWQ